MNYENLTRYKGDGKSLACEIVSFILTFVVAVWVIRVPYFLIRHFSSGFPANYSYDLQCEEIQNGFAGNFDLFSYYAKLDELYVSNAQ